MNEGGVRNLGCVCISGYIVRKEFRNISDDSGVFAEGHIEL